MWNGNGWVPCIRCTTSVISIILHPPGTSQSISSMEIMGRKCDLIVTHKVHERQMPICTKILLPGEEN